MKRGRARTIYSGLEKYSENAVIGRLLVLNPMRKCRAETETERVGHRRRRVDKCNAIARIVEGHAEEMSSGVNWCANEHEPRTLELKLRPGLDGSKEIEARWT